MNQKQPWRGSGGEGGMAFELEVSELETSPEEIGLRVRLLSIRFLEKGAIAGLARVNNDGELGGRVLEMSAQA